MFKITQDQMNKIEVILFTFDLSCKPHIFKDFFEFNKSQNFSLLESLFETI